MSVIEMKLLTAKKVIARDIPSLIKELKILFPEGSIDAHEEEHKEILAAKDKEIEMACCYITTLLKEYPREYALARKWLKRNQTLINEKSK